MRRPALDLSYHFGDETTRASIGVGFTLPLARGNDEFESGWPQTLARLMVSGSQGMWNIWRIAVEGTAVFIPLRVESRVATSWVLGAEAAGGLVITEDEPGINRNDGLVGQSALYGGFVAQPFIMGLRLQGVALRSLGDGGDTDAQFALVPFVQLDAEGAYAQLRVVYNIDDPLAEADAWGLHLGGGVNF